MVPEQGDGVGENELREIRLQVSLESHHAQHFLVTLPGSGQFQT